MIQVARWTLLGALLSACPAFVQAQPQQPQRQKNNPVADDRIAETELTVKVYRVDDLVLPSPSYPFRGTSLPGMAPSSRPMGLAGMMIGQGNAMGGGGAATSTTESGPGLGMTMEGLVRSIRSLIAPTTWEELGGSGVVTTLGGSLIVRQTPANQSQIREFIEDLRREVGAMRTLTVKACWLSLKSDELERLVADDDARSGGNLVRRQAWRDLAASRPEIERYRGQVTCFNGQTVHIVSGRIHSVVQGGTPVVSGSGVGYQALTLAPHIGALLQVTPSLLAGGRMALIDLQSTVTRWDETAASDTADAEVASGAISGEPVEGANDGLPAGGPSAARNANAAAMPRGRRAMTGQSMMQMMRGMGGGGGAPGGFMEGATEAAVAHSPPIDRLNIVAQQLATSLRMPVDQPVLVGGMTFPSSGADQASSEQLYLVLEVIAPDDVTDSAPMRSDDKPSELPKRRR